MATFTVNYNLNKPGINDPTDQDLWGGYLNDDLDIIDSQMKANEDLASGATSTKTGNYTVLTSDRNSTILVDATSGNVTITLIAAASAGDGFEVTIKKIDATANTVIIDGNASETIDGALTQTLTAQYDTLTIVCNGANWFSKTDAIAKATKANMEAQTADKYPDAAVFKYHPSVPKAWGRFDASSGTIASTEYYNASVVRASTGVYTVTLTAPMNTTTYAVLATGRRTPPSSGGEYVMETEVVSASVFTIRTFVNNVQTNAIDMTVNFTVFGTLA